MAESCNVGAAVELDPFGAEEELFGAQGLAESCPVGAVKESTGEVSQYGMWSRSRHISNQASTSLAFGTIVRRLLKSGATARYLHSLTHSLTLIVLIVAGHLSRVIEIA